MQVTWLLRYLRYLRYLFRRPRQIFAPRHHAPALLNALSPASYEPATDDGRHCYGGTVSHMTDRRQDVITAIDQAPDLGEFGYNCGHIDRKRLGCTNLMCGKPATAFEQDRSALLSEKSLTVIESVMGIIGACRTTTTFGAESPGSYQLKHTAEWLLKDDPAAYGYVSNGQAIAAALALDIPVRRDGHGSPNADIGLHVADYRQLRQEAELAHYGPTLGSGRNRP